MESTGFIQTYDAWGRLVKVTNGGSTVSTYKYNGLNRVIERLDSPTQLHVYYYYNTEDQILEEWSVFYGTVYHWKLWGTQGIDDLVVDSDSVSTPNYTTLDHNNNVTTHVSNSGSIGNRFVYVEYGTPKRVSADYSTFQSVLVDWNLFTSRHYQADQGRFYYRNRTQDSELSVFLQRDPIGIWGDIASYGNAYSYVANNPSNASDPFGLISYAGLGPGADKAADKVCRRLCDKLDGWEWLESPGPADDQLSYPDQHRPQFDIIVEKSRPALIWRRIGKSFHIPCKANGGKAIVVPFHAQAPVTVGLCGSIPTSLFYQETVEPLAIYDQKIFPFILWGYYFYDAWVPRPADGEHAAIAALAGAAAGWLGAAAGAAEWAVGAVGGGLGYCVDQIFDRTYDEHTYGWQTFPLQAGLCKCKRYCD